MKAIIPLAGKGTRMRPLTHHTPKPLLKVGGKPVLAYLLDEVIAAGMDEVVFVVGYLGDVLREWIAEEYPDLKCHFVVQEDQNGTAGAVALAEPFIDEELFILFSDALFDADLEMVNRLSDGEDGVIWAMEVEDYQRFGVIVTAEDGSMQRIVEKPSEPISKLANIGVYYIRDWQLLFEGVRHVMDGGGGKGGEFYLTDAFQYMVDHGAKLKVAPVEGWYDAGKPDTYFPTNAHLLATTRGGIDETATVEGTEIVEPVRIEAGASVRGGRIGPNVTVETGAILENAVIADSVIGDRAHLSDVELTRSIVGSRARVVGVKGSVSVSADSIVESS